MNIIPYKKDNKTYYKFQIRIGRKVTRRQGFRTKQEAILEYSNLIENYNNYETGKIKFKEIFDMFIKVYKTKVKQSTLRNNIRVFEIHILPIFGNIYVQNITPAMCQEFAMNMSKYVKGKEFFNQAKRVMEYALKLGYIESNPFDRVIHPNYKKGEIKIDYLEVSEVNTLLEYFKDDLYWYTAFRTLIYTGLRRGELLALLWEDVDFKNNKLSVNKTLTVGLHNKIIVDTPKTTKSIRTINVDKVTILHLKRLKIKSKSRIIFPNKRGEYTRLSNISDKLNKAIKDTNMKQIRVHDLRHTHASLLFASGSNAKEVQDRLGHSDIKTTMNIYTHVTKDKKKESLENFVNYLSG